MTIALFKLKLTQRSKVSYFSSLGMNKIHNEKVKSLLNSIQILKKEKASI